MPTNHRRNPDIILAWAAEVSVAQLAARLMAYAETRAAITAFRLSARNTALKPMNNIPEEVLWMIASDVRELAFTPWMEEFVEKGNCLVNKCSTLSHLSQAAIAGSGADYCACLAHPRLTWAFRLEAQNIHKDNVQSHCSMLTSLDETRIFAKAKQIFIADFKLNPYFLLQKFYDKDGHDFVEAKAFLTLPISEMPTGSSPGNGTRKFAFCGLVDPLALTGLTEEQQKRFEIAANVLKLDAFGYQEDESSRTRKVTAAEESGTKKSSVEEEVLDPQNEIQAFSRIAKELDPKLRILGCVGFEADGL
ncbi:MAG: hypothetical protein Q9170_005707 [Blastenia crenularia]